MILIKSIRLKYKFIRFIIEEIEIMILLRLC